MKNIDKLYINYKGEKLIRLKVKAPNENVLEGQVDVLIDIIGDNSIKYIYATEKKLINRKCPILPVVTSF